jgi:hypothetical protein
MESRLVRTTERPRHANQVARLVSIAAVALAVVCLFPARASAQGPFYVRAGATGNNSGTDWTNAYIALPATLLRGATYFVAAGSYPAHTFSDPVDGTRYITIQKATVASHGTETGWDGSYAQGAAQWAPTIKFTSSYYVFDGVTGGGPGQWTSGLGFLLSSTDDTIFVMFSDKWAGPSGRVNVSNISVSHVEIAGRTPVEAGIGTAFDATALGAHFNNLFISNCYVHDVGGIQFYWINVTDSTLEYSHVARNASSPTHHGAMLRLDEGCARITVRWNDFEDIVGTGWIGSYALAGVDSVEIYRNVFHGTPGFAGQVGNGVVYTQGLCSATNWRVHDNSFVNIPFGPLINFYNGSANTAYNNLFYKITGTPYSSLVTHDYGWFAEPSGSYGETNAESGTGDPFMNWSTGDFRLRQATSPGMVLTGPYNRDMLGKVSATTWNRGALQTPAGVPTAPTNVRIIR